jgi:hypothetical protein
LNHFNYQAYQNGEKEKKELQAVVDLHSPMAVSLSSLLVWFAMNENKPVDLKTRPRGS